MNDRWTWRPLGELFEIGAGKTMSAAARNGPDKTPFLRTSNVLWDEIDLSSVDEMSIPEHELPAKLLRRGDLLVCEGGEIGRAAIWNGEVEPMSFQNHLHRLRPIADEVEPRFYVYFLQSAFTQLGLFEGTGNRTTIPNLSRSRLAALEVPQPRIAEQRAIILALEGLRKAAKLHARGAMLARDLKRAAMQILFTQGLGGEAQKETQIGPMPESWKLVDFASVREKLQYGTSTRCTYNKFGRPVLRIPNIESQRITSDDLKFCMLTDSEADTYQLEVGDLIFIRTNGVLARLGSCAVYDGHPSNALFASYLIRAKVKPDCVVPHFVASFFGSETGARIMAGRSIAASDGKFNLNMAAIDSLLFPLPSTLNEQREIVGILETIEKKISVHWTKHEMLEELYKALLHKLMEGEMQIDSFNLLGLHRNTRAAKEALEPSGVWS